MSGSRPPAVFLMGPTASGKTELGVELVARLGLSIISVDSAMVYRGMDIGTAKPGPEVLAVAPHRLIDIRDPGDPYSAAQFRLDACREMADIEAGGRVPLLLGGTMLYFRALERGLAPLPGSDAGVRARLDSEARELGLPALHARLAAVDPQAAARIHPNDPQRIQRALEVYEVSGKPLSYWLEAGAAARFEHRAVKVAVAPSERAELHRRIEQRFRRMLEQGLVEEVEALFRRGDLSPALPALRAVGYRQVWSYLEGHLSYDAMIDAAVVATRQLARRQLTWLRADHEVIWFDALDAQLHERVAHRIEGELR